MKQIFPTGGVWDGGFELIESSEPVPDGYTDALPPQPAYKAAFLDGRWVETATEDEIAAIKGTSKDEGHPLTTAEQMAALQAKLDTQQQAFTELSNLVFTVADQDKLAAALGL